MSGHTVMGRPGTKLRARPTKRQQVEQELSAQIQVQRSREANLIRLLETLANGSIWAFYKWRKEVKKAADAAKGGK